MLSLWSSGNSDIMFGTAFFPFSLLIALSFLKPGIKSSPLEWGKVPHRLLVVWSGMNHSAPFAVHWQITRTRSWELGQQRERAKNEVNWWKNMSRKHYLWKIHWLVPYFCAIFSFFFHFKGNGSYSRSESLVGAAREVCLPDSPFISILSQHGASACAR